MDSFESRMNPRLLAESDSFQALLSWTLFKHQVFADVYKSVKLLISSLIRRFLTEDAAKTLVTSCILSRLDYCNCFLMGTPNSVIQPLQKIQNFAARLVLLAPRTHHSTPLLEKQNKKLLWLPISERVKYNVACMCFNATEGSFAVACGCVVLHGMSAVALTSG